MRLGYHCGVRPPELAFASLSVLLLGCRSAPVTAASDAASISEAEIVEAEPGFIDLFVDENYGCVLAHDGRVWCWGSDPATRLGLRTASEPWQQATPISGLESVVAIDGDRYSTCAVLDDGQVWCWQIPLRGHP